MREGGIRLRFLYFLPRLPNRPQTILAFALLFLLAHSLFTELQCDNPYTYTYRQIPDSLLQCYSIQYLSISSKSNLPRSNRE